MEKTVKEWLSELPEPYKARALANLCREGANKHAATMLRDSMHDALVVAFMWAVSPEGSEFWTAVSDHYAKGTPLPKIKRGGARIGAGAKRKPDGTVKQSKTFTLDPDVVAHKPTSSLVNQLLRNEYGI
jgi:hypothetical protein